jgi:hypothetical protein
LLKLAREHLGDGSPGLQPVHLAHAAAEGALDLVERGKQAQGDEGEEGDGDENLDERKGV